MAEPQSITPFPTDEKSLSIAFREYMEQEAGIRSIGEKTTSMTQEQIALEISSVKEKERQRKEAKKPYKYIPPGGWKSFDAETLAAIPAGKPDPAIRARTMTNISKYRELTKPRIWDQCMAPSGKLKDLLWRKTIPDGTGARIFNLSREAYPKDIPAQWAPGKFDQDLPPASLGLITESFRNMLVKHVESVPVRVAKDLKTLPAKTTADHNYKSRVSGELAALEKCRDSVISELQKVKEEEEKEKIRAATFAATRKGASSAKSKEGKAAAVSTHK
jgi:hypothetical protein